MQRPEAIPVSEVIRLLRNKIARNPGDLDAGLMLGSALYKTGDLAGSASAFKALLSQQPGHSHALLLLARTEARSGHITEALEVLAHAQQVDASNTQAWQVAAALASDARKWPELQRIGSGWTKAHPTSHEAWQTLSRAYFEESQFSEAITAYAKVLDLQPGDPSVLIGAARLEIAAQQYQQARRHLDAARNIAPDSPELLYSLCRVHHMTGELDAAEDYCRRAIAARPGFATAYVELGTLREGRLNDTEIQAVDKMFKDESVHPEYRVMLGFTLGDALDRKGELERAFNTWDEANNINRKISEQEGFVYQRQIVEREAELLAGIFANSVELNPGALSTDGPRPIFVVGMPRSGTTLIESILASHSEVYGAGELPTLYDIHEELMAVARDQGIETARE
ncbi:MAG: tetratricopeptide repeat protein, partial [Gammaproteobacteria bacterium]|nr:tetratricopeptide repeat protein [Gammaproteobacteria bacterium]